MNRMTIRRALGASAAAAVLATAGCGGVGGAAPMMGGPSGYRYMRLSCTPPADQPGQVVTVMLADMGMTRMMSGPAPLGARMMLRAVPATATAGPITFVAENMGWRTHELVILPLTAGSAAGRRTPGPDGRIDETGSLGEASRDCAAGEGDGIPAGSVGWVTLTLPPGRYEIVCNVANHYADGMREQFTVTGGAG